METTNILKAIMLISASSGTVTLCSMLNNWVTPEGSAPMAIICITSWIVCAIASIHWWCRW